MATVDWLNYLNNQKVFAPRAHIIEAHHFLGNMTQRRIAVDCGCGTGRDTIYLLEKNYQVYAFDNDMRSLEALVNHPLAAATPKLDVQICNFSEFTFPRSHLINASACLFFCPKHEFNPLWKNIEKSLYSGGVFCGHFISVINRNIDEKLPVLTHSKYELEQLFNSFYIVSWKEKQEFSAQLTGEKRAWLVHTIIAMKK
ncbi:trans-aconitate 2-methyltransferase [uncultured Photobacterium sp.]|uniref:class I SAM-dependent methyltransferase n=1 Tax=uncultured Photobacterium sp. TaxID=173973 RepID=UPI002639360F|nr:class I SAM-dependent methyltransferase [uncultured Photobacterium sp.]